MAFARWDCGPRVSHAPTPTDQVLEWLDPSTGSELPLKYRLTCALFLGVSLAQAASAAQLIWLNGDSQGPALREVRRLLAQQAPDLRQLERRANAKRSWQSLARGEEACHISAVRTPEREAIAWFAPYLLMPPPQLIVQRDRVSSLPLNARGEVQLAQLLADPQWHGVLIDGRSYGPRIDALMAAPARARISRVSAPDFGSQMMELLQRGRADFSVEYDLMLHRFASAQARERLQAMPLAEAGEALVVGVACPRTTWGQGMIKEVRAALARPDAARRLKQALLEELSAETAQRYAPQIDAFYAQFGRDEASTSP